MSSYLDSCNFPPAYTVTSSFSIIFLLLVWSRSWPYIHVCSKYQHSYTTRNSVVLVYSMWLLGWPQIFQAHLHVVVNRPQIFQQNIFNTTTLCLSKQLLQQLLCRDLSIIIRRAPPSGVNGCSVGIYIYIYIYLFLGMFVVRHSVSPCNVSF